MNEPIRPASYLRRADVEVHQPTSLTPAPHLFTGPVVPVQSGALPGVQSVQLPDGRIVTGYALAPQKPVAMERHTVRPTVSRTAVNLALGGIGFAAVCGGLVLLSTFIAALAGLVHQLVVLAAVIFGGWVAVQVLGSGRSSRSAGTTVRINKAVFKGNTFNG